MYIISACLIGQNCRYNGGNNKCDWVVEFSRTCDYLPVCPEQTGGLPTPRPPAEISGGRAIDKNGMDVTGQFMRGAQESWNKAQAAADRAGQGIEGAILKANSPSCGCGEIYDGTFSGTLVSGYGFFARLLKEKGIKVTTEKESIK